MRVVIAGPPRTGKTTLAHRLGQSMQLDPLAVQHTDELVGVLEWSEASDEITTWLSARGPWVIEGVATVRALRKWLRLFPAGTPADRVYWLAEPRVALTPGQVTMTKGTYSIWDQVYPLLVARGVRVINGGAS